MSGMWDAYAGNSAEGQNIRDMIALTEREIYNEALNIVDDDDSYDDSLEQLEDFDGTARSDESWMREHTGDDGEADELRAENEQLHRILAQYEEANRPPPADMFANPEQWREELINDVSQGRLPRYLNYGQPNNPEPDMFADPQAHTAWVINEAARRSGVAEHHEARVNASMLHAHQTHGADWETAWNDILSLPKNPQSAAIAKAIVDSPDPGSAVLQVWSALKGQNIAAQRFGGPTFAPMMASSMRRGTNHAARSKGLYYEAPRTAEEAEEESIFNYAFED